MTQKKISGSLTTLAAWSFEITSYALKKMPPVLRPPLVAFMGILFGKLARSMRMGLEHNLRLILNMTEPDIKNLSHRIFKNFALTLLDFFIPEKVSIDVPERRKLEALRSQHNGVLVLTFHLGHWELGARTLQQWGWPVSAVYQPYRNKKFKKVIESRRAPGVNFIPVGGKAANGVREALRRGDMVAMLGDHPFGEDGAAVNLGGHSVVWPKGPIVLAVKEKVPIVVAVIVRTAQHHYEAIIEDPLFPQSKTKSEVQRLIQAVADKFGKLVARYPEQWYRFRAFEVVSTGCSSVG